jgi:hypothetical protein
LFFREMTTLLTFTVQNNIVGYLLKDLFAVTTLITFLFLASCREERSVTAFTSLTEAETGITFSNNLNQTAQFNIIEYLYFYNGGGVAAGDINNDGLTDVYFTANQLSNKLYLNKGNFVFEDITKKAGASGTGNWKTGVTMADVNGDGYLDIFVCGVGNYKGFNGRNQLLINNGDLTFTDKTAEYGLTFQGFSTHASFFDYDNDGDLDMYLLNHSVHTPRSYGHSRIRHQSDRFAGDKLYRNDLIPEGVNRFTEVTSVAGIFNSQVGYGLGIGVSDLNWDGYADLYVSNDFHENDYLYLNQGNGSFVEGLKEAIPHVSRFSMGNDIADINNDGLSDIITLDMLPKDEEVIKTTAGEDPFDIYEFKLRFGFHHQFARNTLQLNQGLDREGQLFFSDIAPLAGVEASDWSWAPLLADFDNDGYKDLFIANGILSRPNDLDYIHFISSDSARAAHSYEEFVEHMPSGKVPDVFYKNGGNLIFHDVSREWIGVKPTLSTGAAYADFDNDGDLDLAVNNVNAPAVILRNDVADASSGWLQVELKGSGANTFGVGTKVIVYSGEKVLYQEQVPSRGWQSAVSPVMHIGVGKNNSVDSVHVIWPDGKFQMLSGVRRNQRLQVFQDRAEKVWDYARKRKVDGKTLLTEQKNFPFIHRENNHNAFNEEKLIPHMVSTQGPSFASGDVNGDGLDDVYAGGAAGQAGRLLIQKAGGDFLPVNQPALDRDSLFEDAGAAFVDADGNGTLDLIVVSGGQEFPRDHNLLRPRLYLNVGSGIFQPSEERLPALFSDASCVKPADMDGDGDMDIFIGGRVIAKKYGITPSSFLLTNDGRGKFTDESWRLSGGRQSQAAPGMVTDAAWTDVNADGKPDLVLVGEWMPVSILIQDKEGLFQNRTREYRLERTNGWWNTILAHDFDGDGDTDLVAGNLGLNSRLKATADRPVSLYAGDMDQNGGTDHLLTYYNEGRLHPFISRDQLVKQVPSFRRDFLKYSNFRKVTPEEIIPARDTAAFAINKAYNFASVYLENTQDDFRLNFLPVEAQLFPIFSFCLGDFDNDGNDDLLAAGNLFAVQPEFGRYDAGYGLMMLGDGKGNFAAVSPQKSGFQVRGEGRDITSLLTADGNKLYLVGRNNDSALLFK